MTQGQSGVNQRLRFTQPVKTDYNCLGMNEINQVLVSLGDAATTNRIIKKTQDDGTCWCGGMEGHNCYADQRVIMDDNQRRY